MTKTFILTGFEPGTSHYVETTQPLDNEIVTFSGKTAVVRTSGVATKMTNVTLVVQQPFGVNSCADDCRVGELNASAKVQLNIPYGDSTVLEDLVVELNRLITLWRANNMAYGVVPSINTSIDEV